MAEVVKVARRRVLVAGADRARRAAVRARGADMLVAVEEGGVVVAGETTAS